MTDGKRKGVEIGSQGAATGIELGAPTNLRFQKEVAMPRYVVLYRFTDEGLKHIKDTVNRAQEVRRMNESRGFKVIGTYWTQGHYDLVSIVEAPSEEAMNAGLFNIAEAGNVHSETLRAFDEAEMSKALSQA
jgi:uncharacterized protein with GYD domain